MICNCNTNYSSSGWIKDSRTCLVGGKTGASAGHGYEKNAFVTVLRQALLL